MSNGYNDNLIKKFLSGIKTKPDNGADKNKTYAKNRAESLQKLIPAYLSNDKAFVDIPGLQLEHQNTKPKTTPLQEQELDRFAGIEVIFFYYINADVLSEISDKPQNTMNIESGVNFKTIEEASEYLLKKRNLKYKQSDIDKLATELIMLNSNNNETTIDDKVNNALENINKGEIRYSDGDKYKYITGLIKECGFEQNFENSAIYQTIYSILDLLQQDGRRESINLFNKLQTTLEETAKTKNPEELKQRFLTEYGINLYSESEQDKAKEIQLQSFTTGLLSNVYGYLAGQTENLYENGGLFNSFANKIAESTNEVANRFGKDIHTNKEKIEFLKETAEFWNEYQPTANSEKFKSKFKRIYGKDFDEKKAKDLMNYCSKNPNLDIFKDKEFQKKFKEFCGTDIITDIKKSLKGQQYTAMAGNAVMVWMGMNATGALLGTNYMGYCLGNGLSKLGLSGKALQLATAMPIGSATFATWTLAEKTLENAITLQGPASEKWDNIAKAVGQSAEFGAFASALNVLLISPMVSPNVEKGLSKGAEYVKSAKQPVSFADYMQACEAGSSPVIKNGLVKFGYSLAVNTVGFTAHQTAADLITNGTEPFKNGNGGKYIGNLLLENFKTIMTFEGINLITGGYSAGNIASKASKQMSIEEMSKNFECLKNFTLEPKGNGFLINFPQAVEVNGKTMTSMSVNTPAEMFSMVVTIMNAETNWKINNANLSKQGQNQPQLQQQYNLLTENTGNIQNGAIVKTSPDINPPSGPAAQIHSSITNGTMGVLGAKSYAEVKAVYQKYAKENGFTFVDKKCEFEVKDKNGNLIREAHEGFFDGRWYDHHQVFNENNQITNRFVVDCNGKLQSTVEYFYDESGKELMSVGYGGSAGKSVKVFTKDSRETMTIEQFVEKYGFEPTYYREINPDVEFESPASKVETENKSVMLKSKIQQEITDLINKNLDNEPMEERDLEYINNLFFEVIERSADNESCINSCKSLIEAFCKKNEIYELLWLNADECEQLLNSNYTSNKYYESKTKEVNEIFQTLSDKNFTNSAKLDRLCELDKYLTNIFNNAENRGYELKIFKKLVNDCVNVPGDIEKINNDKFVEVFKRAYKYLETNHLEDFKICIADENFKPLLYDEKILVFNQNCEPIRKYEEYANIIAETIIDSNGKQEYTVQKDPAADMPMLNSVRKVYDKQGYLLYTETYKRVDGLNKYKIYRELPNGNKYKIGTVEQFLTGSIDIEKNLISNSGYKTNYRYCEDPDGGRFCVVDIKDPQNQVSCKNSYRFCKTDENHFWTIENGIEYHITYDKNQVTVKRSDGKQVILSIGKNTKDGGAFLSEDLVPLLKQMPGSFYFDIENLKLGRIIMGNTSGNRNAAYDFCKQYIRIDTDDTHAVFTLCHEFGHFLAHELGILENEDVIESFIKEREKCESDMSSYEFSETQYLIFKMNSERPEFSLDEFVAETNALLYSSENWQELELRSQFIQQYFPETFSKVANILNDYHRATLGEGEVKADGIKIQDANHTKTQSEQKVKPEIKPDAATIESVEQKIIPDEVELKPENDVVTNADASNVRSGNFDKSLALIADNLINQTGQHLSVKGGVKTQAQIIETVSEELGKYLAQYKGKHITKGQLEAFYKEVFPELNIVIDGSKPEKDLLGTTPKAVTRTPYTKGVYKGSIEIQLHSESPMDKLNSFLGNENEGTFYVSPDFVDSFIHENVHIMQMYMKPVDKIYQNTLNDIAETRHPENSEDWSNGYGIDGAMAYNIIVYKEEWPLLFNEERFIEKVRRSLDVYYATDDVKIAHLKQFIRYSEGEKQAYEQGILNKLRFKHPDLADKPFYDRLFRKIAAKEADSFKFERKIEVMKKEYFRMIEEERSKIQRESKNEEISAETEIKQEKNTGKSDNAPKYTPESVKAELEKYLKNDVYDINVQYKTLFENLDKFDYENMDVHLKHIKKLIDLHLGKYQTYIIENGYFSSKKGAEVFEFFAQIFNAPPQDGWVSDLEHVLANFDVNNFENAQKRGLLDEMNLANVEEINKLAGYSDYQYSKSFEFEKQKISYVSNNDDINSLLLKYGKDYGDYILEIAEKRLLSLKDDTKIKQAVDMLIAQDNKDTLSILYDMEDMEYFINNTEKLLELDKKFTAGENAQIPSRYDYGCYTKATTRTHIYRNPELTKLMLEIDKQGRFSDVQIFEIAVLLGMDEADFARKLVNIESLSVDQVMKIMRDVDLIYVQFKLEMYDELELYNNLSAMTPEELKICKSCGLDIEQILKELAEKFDKKYDIISISKEQFNRFNKTILANNNPKAENLLKTTDFAKFGKSGIPLKYTREHFSSNLNDILAPLTDAEQTEILSHFGLERGAAGSFDGLPNNVPYETSDGRLAKTAELVRKEIENFTLHNETVSKDAEFKAVMDDLIKGFPEFVLFIGKVQHGEHAYSVDIHTLKVLQSAMNDPMYSTLSDMDKTVLKLSVLMHDFGKKEGAVDEGHEYASTDYANAILERYSFPADVKRRITDIISDHHWFAKFNTGIIDAWDVAHMCRDNGTFKIMQIMAKADFENVNNDGFQYIRTNTNSKKEYDKYMREKFAEVDKARRNINKYSSTFYNSRLVVKGKYPKQKVIANGRETMMGVLNTNEIPTGMSMEQYGYAPGVTSDNFVQVAHFTDNAATLETALKICYDPHKVSDFSAGVFRLHDNNSFGAKKFCVIFDYNQVQFIDGANHSLQSGCKKGIDDIKHCFDLKEHFDSAEIKNVIKSTLFSNYVILTDNEYAKFSEYLFEHKYLTQMKDGVRINGKKISLSLMQKCNQAVTDYLLSIDEYNPGNEVRIEDPIPVAIGIQARSMNEVPQWFIDLADKYGLNIQLLKPITKYNE